MTGWRGWALGLGVVIAAIGIWVWIVGGGPMVAIFGGLLVLTAALEPIYGRADGKPAGREWRATAERFVDPETGKLVTVWFDPVTGGRRYVADAETR